MNMQITTQSVNAAHAFIMSQVSGEEVITSLPYAEAVEMARLIISQSSQPELKFAVGGDIYEMFEWEGKFEVRATFRGPVIESTSRSYSTFLAALTELQRQYHEAIGWNDGLSPLFVPENDHQANGQCQRQEHEIRSCAAIENDRYMINF